MEYFPSIAITGGYTHQNVVNTVLPENFGYIGSSVPIPSSISANASVG
jgi:hypothetical protein